MRPSTALMRFGKLALSELSSKTMWRLDSESNDDQAFVLIPASQQRSKKRYQIHPCRGESREWACEARQLFFGSWSTWRYGRFSIPCLGEEGVRRLDTLCGNNDCIGRSPPPSRKMGREEGCASIRRFLSRPATVLSDAPPNYSSGLAMTWLARVTLYAQIETRHRASL